MADPTGSTEDIDSPQGNSASPEPDDRVQVSTSAWNRVKEHKILQWGLGYLGAAIAIAHGQELMAEAFDWPHLIGRILVSVLVLGFPLVLTLAWYHGHKGLKRVGPGELGILSLLILIAAGMLVVFVRAPEGRTVDSESQTRAHTPDGKPAMVAPNASVAVLPFKDMSPAKDQEYFTDGITEEIQNSLATLHGLKVTGRASSFYFKGKDENLRTIGEMLGVATVLEGAVRKEGNQLRITTQLNDARTGYHLWSQTYERPLDDVFKIQEDIARSVAQALEITLGVGGLGQQPGMTRNVEAYDAYLAGVASLQEYTQESGQRGMGLLQKAVSLDPEFAIGWATISSVNQTAAEITGDTSAWLNRPDVELARVKQLIPNSPRIYALVAGRSIVKGDWRDAARQFESARSAASRQGLQAEFPTGEFLCFVGRCKEGVAALERAKVNDPLNSTLAVTLAEAYASAGDLPAAIAEQDRATSLGGPQTIAHIAGIITALGTADRALIKKRLDLLESAAPAVSYDLVHAIPSLLDHPDAAPAELHRFAANTARFDERAGIALLASYFGDVDFSLELLRDKRLSMTDRARTIWRPLMRPVRKTSGFKDLVRTMGLVDYWREYGWGDFCHPIGSDDFECL